MESLLNQVKALLSDKAALHSLVITALFLAVGCLGLGLIGRFVFGKKSVFNQSVSSAIGILFIYAATVVIHSCGLDLKFLVSPLPFVSISGDTLSLFPILQSDFKLICGEVLNLLILAFLVNLANSWLPTGKNLFTWLFLRVISIVLGMAMYAIANYLLNSFIPIDIRLWAPVILLGVLVLLLLLGGLKVIVGALLITINPLIGGLYTFFFATIAGKMISKAALTTLLLTGLVCLLAYFSIAVISISTSILLCYIPLVILMLILWYIVGKLL